MSAYSYRGHVYFAAAGKYVKIGYTSGTIAKRLASLPGLCKVPADFDTADTIWLMHSIPGCVTRDERRLHSLFAAHHVMGEWFYMSPEFLAQLSGLQYVTHSDELLHLRRARADMRRRGFNAYANPSVKIAGPPAVAEYPTAHASWLAAS